MFYSEALRSFKGQGHPVFPVVPQVAEECPKQPLPLAEKVWGRIKSREKRPGQTQRPRQGGTLKDIPRATACKEKRQQKAHFPRDSQRKSICVHRQRPTDTVTLPWSVHDLRRVPELHWDTQKSSFRDLSPEVPEPGMGIQLAQFPFFQFPIFPLAQFPFFTCVMVFYDLQEVKHKKTSPSFHFFKPNLAFTPPAWWRESIIPLI